MKNFILIFLTLLQMTALCQAQSFEYIYSTPDDEVINDAAEDSSGNYYLVGWKGTFNTSPNTYSGLIIKLNPQGDTVKTLIIPPLNSVTHIQRISRINDNSFILFGDMQMPATTDQQIYYLKIDSSLNILDEKTFGDANYSETLMRVNKGRLQNEMLLAGFAWYISNNQLEDAISYLEERGEPGARERLLALYVQNGALTEAKLLIDEIESSGCIEPECIDFVALNTILINWEENNISPFEMSPDDHDAIKQIAEHNTRVAVQAQAVMSYVFGIEYQPEVIDTGGFRMEKPYDETNSQVEIKTIKPSPAKDKITIEFASELHSDAEVQIMDVTGRLVLKNSLPKSSSIAVMDISGLTEGIYTARLTVNEVPLQIKKFTKF